MASMPSKTDKSQRGLSASPAESFDPQPDTCLLTSTLFPYELIVPPLMMDPQSNNCYYARPSTRPRRNESAMLQTANFIDPKQAPGVNLRNFKIQAVKYATISDIVIYCPTGYHEGMLSYARWFRDAHEGSYDERCERGLGGLRYNVFIVTEPFDVFEHYHPHLVAVDRMGGLRNRVDFIDREREEMQRLTAAAPIDDNVWLGCTGDSPSLNDDAASVAPSHEFNPKGFSVSIEFHEQGEVPDSNKLLQASQCLDHHRWGDGTMDGLLKETFNSTTDDGWYRDGFESPSSPTLATASLTNGSGKASSYRRTDLPATASGLSSPASSFIRREGNVVHLECHSFSTDPKAKASELEAVSETQKKVDSILRLCAWIQTQAQPWKTPLQATANAPGYGILAGALRSVHYARQNNSGSFGRTASVRHAHREAHNGAATAPWNKRRERRVLLHCADGYTETSILALAYLMYSRGLSLPEAYLDLQDRAKRSFFVYNRDLPLLKELEKQISILRRDAAGEGVPEHASRPRNKHGFPWLGNDEHHGKRRNASCTSPRRNSASSLGPEAIEHNSWMRGLVGWVGASSKRSSPVNASSDALLSPPSRTVTPTPASMASQSSLNTATIQDSSAVTSPSAVSETSSNAWFYSPRFEGSFPSRILPFLYLGNLNHALNASMLHALGITHVVSVGESALQPPAASGSAVADSNGGQTALPSPAEQESANSLWQEEKAGRISVLDLRNVSDDGIDPLRSTMRVAVEYIEAARRAGGKVLVHCRVGVSRSTTIVLAYVMAHLDLTLVESYLLVRSRRLSILIQPHLLFFWELRGWEAYVASQKLKRRLILETGRSSQEQAQDASAVLAEAHFSLAGLSLQGSAVRGEVMNRISSVGSSCGFGSSSDGSDSVVADDLDVDIGAGVGASYHLNTNDDVSRAAFGSGSPSGIPAEALRLNWGFLCREITVLNERYF